MDIFAPNGYSSQYSRGEYSRAKKEKEEAKSDLNKYTKKLSEQLAFLKENVAKYHKGEFTGPPRIYGCPEQFRRWKQSGFSG